MFDLVPHIQFDVTDEVVSPSTAEDEEMQIQLVRNGPWHRRTTGVFWPTACGLPVQWPAATLPVGWLEVRKNEYSGKLCPICFTCFELELSAKANEAAEAEENDDA